MVTIIRQLSSCSDSISSITAEVCTQSDQLLSELPRSPFAPVEPAKAAGLQDALSSFSAGVAGGAAGLHVTAAEPRKTEQRTEMVRMQKHYPNHEHQIMTSFY